MENQTTTETSEEKNEDTNNQTVTESVTNDKTSENKTFKTPSFVIPSKRKVQTNAEASTVFKSPEQPTVKTKSPETNTAETVPKNASSMSPAEQLGHAKAAVPYKEPTWSSLCEQKYSFEVIKNGAFIENIDLTPKPYHVIGRIPSCDILMEHPSLSRYHAVIQYSDGSSEDKPKGWYLYDLDSTHGTWINKNKIPPGKFHRLHVDYVLKFGGSTRLFIIQGPDEDRQEESELSVTEMKEQREKQIKETELLRQAEIEEAERKSELMKRKEEEKGCSWGINEEAEDDDDSEENPYANIVIENEQLYIDDPKKSLNGYFEREGYDPPEYEFTETGFGKWKCTVELPVDSLSGEPMRGEVVVSGKKKDAVVACALEACRMLDRMGELRKSTHESRKKKQRNWEDDDYYDSDEDVYLDRTGTIEKKREYRKMKVGKSDKASDTYDSLLEKHKAVLAEIEELNQELEKAKAQAAAMESEDVDALDAYMSAIKSGMMDTKTKMKLKRQLMELKQEEQKIRKLVNVAKPASMPELVKRPDKQETKPSILSAVGKMKGPVIGKVYRKPNLNVKDTRVSVDDVVEEEDEEDDYNQQDKGSEKGSEQVAHEGETNKGTIKQSNKAENVKISSAKAKPVNIPSEKEKLKKPKGPSMPLAAVLQQLQSETESMDTESGNIPDDVSDFKSSSKRKMSIKGDTKKKLKTDTGSYDCKDPDYATWLPPDSQSGDGKTYLNDKFGY